ncbi:sulfite exporter TauE/SafE family protein [bacterium]|nr:sulfite exporter TauE/SafE family protein [bacterium]
MNWHDLLFAFIGFLSEILGTISGFGSSTFFVPVAQMLESFHLVLVLTALLHSIGNLSRLYYFKNSFDKKLFIKMALPSIALSGLGALLTKYIPTDLLSKALGAGLIIISIVLFFKKTKQKSLLSPAWGAPLVGLSGFMTGLLGTGGAIRGVALASLQIEKGLFIGLSSAIDLGGDVLRLAIYLYHGYMDWNEWYYIPMLALSAWAGAKIGHRLIQFVPQDLFIKTVTAFIFIGGAVLVIQ